MPHPVGAVRTAGKHMHPPARYNAALLLATCAAPRSKRPSPVRSVESLMPSSFQVVPVVTTGAQGVMQWVLPPGTTPTPGARRPCVWAAP